MARVSQSVRDALKGVLDRRYALTADIEAIRSELHDLRNRLQTTGDDVGRLESEISTAMKAANDRLVELEHRLDAAQASIAAVVETTRPAVAFVAEEEPHELRKRLFEAHRLAREGAFAIEQLLQTEVLLRRDLEQVASNRSVPDSP